MNTPYYTRLALLGIALYLSFVALLLMLALALAPSEWEYPLIVGGIAGSVAMAVYFWRPWGLVPGILLGLIGIPFSLDSWSENVSSPDSFLNFAYQPVFALPAAILLLSGSSAGLIQHFRHRTSFQGPKLASNAVRGLFALVGILSLSSAVFTFASVDSVSASNRAGAIQITAEDFEFDTAAVAASPTGSTKLLVRNRDYIVHTFTVDALEIDVKVGPRGERLVELNSPPAGNYEFHCTVSGHESMRGTLTVE